MAKCFDYNLKSNLEVVEEVEEENAEEEETSESYEDNAFEELEENTEFESCCEEDFIVENIQSIVEQVLNDILDQIDSQLITENCQQKSNAMNIDLDHTEMLYSPSTSSLSQPNLPNESILVDVKPQNVDSDFVSDDLSSSPETVMTYPDKAV